MVGQAQGLDHGIVFVEGSIRGPVIVCSTHATFPPRCIVCNAPEAARTSMHFTVYPKRTFSPFDWISTRRVLAAEARRVANARRGDAEVGLCSRHQMRQWQLAITMGLFGVLSIAVGGLGVWLVSDHRIDAMLGIVFYLTAIAGCAATAFWGNKSWPLLRARGISSHQMRLSGAGDPFLKSLEKAPAPAIAPASPLPPRPLRR